jgi:2-polyprenyl-3-methyl-5-hydroxy-6-metoxy-1,4-benzoquinol methylase
MPRSRDLVRSWFDREARRFDAIYEARKPTSQRLVDRLFRGVVLERFRLVTILAPLPGAWTALDAGCGPGRYALALAAAGARRVVGVDAAPAMIALARQAAEQAGLAARCTFVASPFLELAGQEAFDVVVATGYFDYLEDPLPELAKMLGHCRGRLFASFPKRWELRAPTRKLRFLLGGGYVRFYAAAEVRRLFAQAGIAEERLALLDLGRDLLAIARVAEAAPAP